MAASCKENGGGAMPRRMMEGRLFTGRRKGRPRLRWKDDVVADWKSNEDKTVDGDDERQRAEETGC
jgi:hypothetical protein